MAGLEPTIPWSQATWGAAPLHPASQSERLDLNQRQMGNYRPRPSSSLLLGGLSCFSWPPARRDARLRYALLSPNDPCGIRTQPGQLERLATSPEVERAMSVCARNLRGPGPPGAIVMWARRRSNPSLLVFSQALNRLSYQPMQCLGFRQWRKTRKPGVLCVTPGF